MMSAGLMGAAVAGCADLVPQGIGLALLPNPLTDPPVYNFALNLEYLEADYYLRGSMGITADEALRGTQGAPVRGGRKVQFSSPIREGMMRNIAANEVAHVRFAQWVTGSNAIRRPPIDFEAGFAAVAPTAGLGSFDPFANEMDFFLGGMLFEDVGVSVLKGSARKLTSLKLRESAAGLLGAEGYHMGAIRSLIYKSGDPARGRAAAISEFRDRLDGPQDLDQPPVQIGALANIAPANENGIAFGRTPQHALNIVYGNRPKASWRAASSPKDSTVESARPDA